MDKLFDFLKRPDYRDLTEFGKAIDQAWIHSDNFNYEQVARWLDVSPEELAKIQTGDIPAPKKFIKRLTRNFQLSDKEKLRLELHYAELLDEKKCMIEKWKDEIEELDEGVEDNYVQVQTENFEELPDSELSAMDLMARNLGII